MLVCFGKPERDDISITNTFKEFDGFQKVSPKSPLLQACLYLVEFTNAEGAAKAYASRNGFVIDDFRIKVFAPRCPAYHVK